MGAIMKHTPLHSTVLSLMALPAVPAATLFYANDTPSSRSYAYELHLCGNIFTSLCHLLGQSAIEQKLH